MRRHYSITHTQLLHTINDLLAVGRVGNLLCGRPSYKGLWGLGPACTAFPRQGSFKGLTQDGFTEVVENVRKLHYLYSWHITGNAGECPATSQATIMFQHDRAPAENTWTMFSPNVGLGGVVQYSGHQVLPISLLWISLSWGDEVFGVRDTDRHSIRAGCPCGRSCSNYSWDIIICTQIPAVH